MKFKKLVLASAISSCLLSSVYAGGMMPNMELMPDDSMQWGVSFVYTDPVHSFGLGFDAQNSRIEMGINGSYSDTTTATNISYSQFFLAGYFGFRKELSSQVFGAIGFMGDQVFYSGNTAAAGLIKEPYSYGPYLGLEYQPTPNYQLYVRAQPYSRRVTFVNTTQDVYFEDGQVGFKYFFA